MEQAGVTTAAENGVSDEAGDSAGDVAEEPVDFHVRRLKGEGHLFASLSCFKLGCHKGHVVSQTDTDRCKDNWHNWQIFGSFQIETGEVLGVIRS